MTMPRYAAKRDITEPEIVNALEKAGATVYRLDHPVDLAVGFRGNTYLVECKSDVNRGGSNKKTKAQAKFIETWRGQVVILYDAQSAFDWISAITSQRAAA